MVATSTSHHTRFVYDNLLLPFKFKPPYPTGFSNNRRLWRPYCTILRTKVKLDNRRLVLIVYFRKGQYLYFDIVEMFDVIHFCCFFSCNRLTIKFQISVLDCPIVSFQDINALFTRLLSFEVSSSISFPQTSVAYDFPGPNKTDL